MNIDIYTKSGVFVSRISKVISCDTNETLDGVYTISFETLIDDNLKNLDDNTSYVINFLNEFYDVSSIKKSLSNGLYKIKIEGNHISYRLSNYSYNATTLNGSVTEILTTLLSGTEFKVGVVDLSLDTTLEIKDSSTIRSIILTLASNIDADVMFSNYSVSIIHHRGNETITSIIDKNVVAISKQIKESNSISYSLTLRENTSLTLGDELYLKFDALSINDYVRLVGIKRRPFTSKNVELELGDLNETIEEDLVSLEEATVTKDNSIYGVKISNSDGLTITRSDNLAKVIMNADEFRMMAKNESGVFEDKLYFDATDESYKFVGSVEVKEGTININDTFKVDEFGNVYMAGDSTIYGGKYYAGSPISSDGYSKMTETGFEVYNKNDDLKLKLGYTTSGEDYPFIQFGSGSGEYADFGLVKKFTDGLWIGNKAPSDESGNFEAKDGYNGIFFRFSDNTAYVVKDEEMKNIYTGYAIARFG